MMPSHWKSGKSVTSALAAGSLLLTSLVSASGTASAGDWRHHPDAPRRVAPHYGHHVPGPQPRHHRRDRTGDAVGAAILGIGAIIVGAAIADAARKKRSYDYDDRD